MYKKYSKFNYPFTSLVEVWRDIIGWEDCYRISSFGRVESKDKIRLKTRQGKLVPARYKGRMMKWLISNAGYARVDCRDGDRNFHYSVHRLLATAFIPNPENKPTVNHKDGNKLNNNISNLEWSTHSEQMQHALENKLLIPGGKRVVSPKVRKEIYQYYLENQVSANVLSKKFNITWDMASEIISGKTEPKWKIPHETLLEIVRLGKQGWSAEDLGKKFNFSKSHAWRIINGKSRLLCLEGLNE